MKMKTKILILIGSGCTTTILPTILYGCVKTLLNLPEAVHPAGPVLTMIFATLLVILIIALTIITLTGGLEVVPVKITKED